MRRDFRFLFPLALLPGLLGVVVATAPHAAATVPAQFSDTLVASVASPIDVAFMPDGRMLIATQPGRLRVMSGGTLLATPALDLSGRVCANSERGLLGVAVDPDAASKAIYVFYTV